MQRLYFDFDIPAGSDLELHADALGNSGNTGLWRDNAGNGNSMAYPYNIGNNVTITTSGPGDQYYYFYYDIEVEVPCENNSTSISDIAKSNKELLRITDLLGRETKMQINTLLLYRYDDGTVDKRIIIE